jgi:hypothetical protein
VPEMPLKRIIISTLFLLGSLFPLTAGSLDFMRSTGKIYVVFGVILILFVGIVLFLILLERRIKKLEIFKNNEQ